MMEVSKPCHQLGYCPYGPLVENFPLDKNSTLRCEVFGHDCPVYSCAEEARENKLDSPLVRLTTRHIGAGKLHFHKTLGTKG